jgi:hypothetical protein
MEKCLLLGAVCGVYIICIQQCSLTYARSAVQTLLECDWVECNPFCITTLGLMRSFKPRLSHGNELSRGLETQHCRLQVASMVVTSSPYTTGRSRS